MYLLVYLKIKGVRLEDFAKKIGISKNTAFNWANGCTRPCETNIQRVDQETDGLVTENDFKEFYRLAHENRIREQRKRTLVRKISEGEIAARAYETSLQHS